MAVITPSPKTQFIDAAGVPLAGGKLYTYAAGTTTPLSTYTDSTGATPNTNPVIMDSRGEANVWLGAATYKFRLTNANDVEIWTVDNIAAPTTSLSPVLSGNVTISTNSSGTALTITQSGTGANIKVNSLAPFTVDTNGQVGIGTVTPSTALDIWGGTSRISSIDGVAYTDISATATDSIFEAASNRNFVIKTNASPRLTITAASATSTVPIILPGVPTTSLQAATKSYVDSVGVTSTPPGAILAYAASTAPSGWLLCNGAAVSRATYSALFSAISTVWGVGDGSTTFNVPDLRGQFLRGYDDRGAGTSADTTDISGITTNTSATVYTATLQYLYVGMSIIGSGIPANTTISSIGSNSIVISNAATATSPTVGGGETTNTSNIVTVTSTSGLYVSQAIGGTGIPAGAYITSIVNGTTIIISAPATATNTGLTFSLGAVLTVGRTFASAELDAYATHNHGVYDVGHKHGLYSLTAYGAGGVTAVGPNDLAGTLNTTNPGMNTVATGVNVNNSVTGNSETRPKNYAVLYIIKT